MNSRPATRRTVLAAAVAAAAGATAAAPSAFAGELSAKPGRAGKSPATVSLHSWSSYGDWVAGETEGTRAVYGRRPAIVFDTAQGITEYRDPHTKKTARWEYATWTSVPHKPSVAAGELIASWNAHTPAGSWLRVELQGMYTDGSETPWYTMGIWTAGDGDDVPRRTSVDDQSDGKSSVWTDTFAIDDLDSGLRLLMYQLRVTLYRAVGSGAKPAVWRLSAMSSDVPDRFEVPASRPGPARGVEVEVPRYSQNVHKGRYPEYDNGGEAWCSPTSSQMIIERWGREPTAEDLEWVNPDFTDPQVCHAARYTFDYQYEGCGNWPFNAAYAATYRNMQAVVTRLGSLTDAERLVAAGIPLITSQSFIESELDGAGYGTAGHLMTVIGFTEDGDVIANDPASKDNDAVRRVYKRRQWENIWLRTKRKDADGKVRSGTGGVCYLYFPTRLSARQRQVLRSLGVN
ncbi:MAG: peptidase C39 family protein [Streptomyces sp.]|uniref:peptidase C39 family protein n=1 Tax=Streptomyces sp. TaxID=1931 RepID=UPI003D6AFA05